MVVEAALDARLDDLEEGRGIEVARHVQAVVANVQDLGLRAHPAPRAGVDKLDFRQDRITQRVEGLRDQGRADRLRRLAAAEREHAPFHRFRQRWSDQVTGQVEDVLQVVGHADARDHEGDQLLDLRLVEADWPADARMQLREFAHRHHAHALLHVHVAQHPRLFAFRRRAQVVADVERGVRPRRLRQVLDGAGEAAGAFHQQHVALAQRGRDHLARARGHVRAVRARLREETRQPRADVVQDPHFSPCCPGSRLNSATNARAGSGGCCDAGPLARAPPATSPDKASGARAPRLRRSRRRPGPPRRKNSRG